MKFVIYRMIGLGLVSLVVSLILTPLVRELNRRLGMVDKPDARRINKVPIPRGGGVAVFLSVILVFTGFLHYYGGEILTPERCDVYPSFLVLGSAIVALGYADDKWSLPPRVKLLGQIAVAFGAWAWSGVGFTHVFPTIPTWLDCLVTICWFVGAINAFNLIDGLDGLATGLAMIATVGMAGALVFTGSSELIFFHIAFFGALLGFLRYNYNPASVFLGDSGSMFLGFVLAILPLQFNTAQSFFVSVGVPLLAMGVPIFDTSLAILRRTIRHFLVKRGTSAAGNDKVMTADTDHLHHRILRASGLDQRRAAWALYGIAFFLVALALANIAFSSHRAGLWLAGLTVAAFIIGRNFARIELYDAAHLLGDMAHDHNFQKRRKYQRLSVPILVVTDILIMVFSYLAICWLVRKQVVLTDLTVALPIQVISTFVALVCFRAYVTIWARAVLSNYFRLFVASVLGAVIGALGVYCAPGVEIFKLRVFLPLYVLLPFSGFVAVRLVRPFFRDLFYALDCSRLVARKDISRILVYGAGLRYAAFRRELVRTTAGNRRIIVGILDDDLLLRGHYVGGIQIKGPLNEAPGIINETNADAVVIACDLTDQWLKVVLDTLRPTGVRVTHFKFGEVEVK